MLACCGTQRVVRARLSRVAEDGRYARLSRDAELASSRYARVAWKGRGGVPHRVMRRASFEGRGGESQRIMRASINGRVAGLLRVSARYRTLSLNKIK
jgi:hypothetical protein